MVSLPVFAFGTALSTPLAQHPMAQVNGGIWGDIGKAASGHRQRVLWLIVLTCGVVSAWD